MNKALLLAVPAVLWLSCQGNTIGAGCTVDSDCDMGQSCFTGAAWPGGFCTKGCVQPGGANDCPGGTVCTETADGLMRFCSIECDNGNCREGYTCATVPQSTHSACRP
jgi:hypothetical protein